MENDVIDIALKFVRSLREKQQCWLSRFRLTPLQIRCDPRRCFLHASGRCEQLREALRPTYPPWTDSARQCWASALVGERRPCAGEACRLWGRRCDKLRREFLDNSSRSSFF